MIIANDSLCWEHCTSQCYKACHRGSPRHGPTLKEARAQLCRHRQLQPDPLGHETDAGVVSYRPNCDEVFRSCTNYRMT